MPACLAPIAEQTQHHQEQVDEVEIEPQRPHDGLAAGDGAVVHRAVQFFDVLRVVGGETDEDEHAEHRDRPIEPARLQKDVDQARDDDADQAHEHERADGGQVTLGRIAVKAHRAERRRRDEEHTGDRRSGVDQEDRRQRDFEHAGIDEEQRQRGARREPVDAEAHEHDQAERRQDEQPHQRAVEDRLAERREHEAGAGLGDGSGEGEPSDQSGQRHAGSHVVVDADHVRAQTRIDRYLIRAIAGPGGRDIPVEVRHREYPWVIPAPAGLASGKPNADVAGI